MRRALATVVVLTGLLGVAACGGDDGDEAGGTSAATTAATESRADAVEVKGAEYA